MRNKVLSLILGTCLGILAGYGHWSQNQSYPIKNEIRISEIQTSEPIKYVSEIQNEDISEDIGAVTEIEQPLNPQNFILRSDTLLYYDDEIPFKVQEYAQIYGNLYDICPEFLEAIAFYESSYVETAENGTCIGLMQINMSCKEQLERMDKFNLGIEDMFNADASMLVAADYLHELFDNYEDPAEVLIRYNGDKTGLKKYKKTGEISEYAAKVLDLAKQLEIKHGK